MMKEDENLNKTNNSVENMGLTYWNRVLLGTAGGFLICSSFWLLTILEGTDLLFILIPMLLGVLVIFYGRFG